MTFLAGNLRHHSFLMSCHNTKLPREWVRETSAERACFHRATFFKEAQGNLRCVYPAALLTLLTFLALLPAYAHKQKDDIRHRTVHGTVVDKDENPVASSVVYLLNVKSKTARTETTGDSGTYQFSGLDPNVDYEIHAEHGDLMSATRTVSSYDTRLDVEIILKLSHQKATH